MGNEAPESIASSASSPQIKPPERLKIVVYAIAQNERKFVDRWMDSMKEADEIVVLDTGSRDGTPDSLKRRRAKVSRAEFVKCRNAQDFEIARKGCMTPWRFDVARNMSIDLAMREVPDADVLVCTDIDEVLLPGWRAKLESAWIGWWREHGEPPTTAQYEYVWNFKPDGSDGTKFMYEKVHLPGVARWAHPVHEILDYGGVPKRMVRVDGMRLEHHADQTKSRGQYLGREYMFAGRWNDAITALRKHLELPRARWRAERAASMRFIAKCEGKLGRETEREAWLWRAVSEDPDQREAALELAEMFSDRATKSGSRAEWEMAVRAAEICVSREKRAMSYLTKPEAWGAWPWELLAIARWRLGDMAGAKSAHERARRENPDDQTVIKNDVWFK